MAGSPDGRNVTRAEHVRYGMVALLLSASCFLLMFFQERATWSWRLAACGAAVGPVSYSLSVSFRRLARAFLRKRNRLVANLLMMPFDFASGAIAFVGVFALFRFLDLLPVQLDGRVYRPVLIICGVMSVEIGALFYLFHLTSRRLMRSARRIKDQEFAERELELARSIQQRLLPPELVTGNGYEVRSRNLAAHYVAGDFYDVFSLADGTVGIAVADVSGKGIGASLIMATVKAILPLVAEGRAPAAVLTELSSRLHGELPPREFIALAYAQFDPTSGILELANAGLPDPYLLRRGTTAEVLSAPGPRLPIAVRRRVAYESLIVTLEPGEAVLLLTDGLPEATTMNEEQLGYDALLDVINDISRQHDEVLDPLFREIGRLSGDQRDDDWTVLILRAAMERAEALSRPVDLDRRRRLQSHRNRAVSNR